MGEAAKKLSPQHLEFLRKLKDDNQFYNRHCLKIRTDDGIVDMVDNEVQDYIEYRAEDQIRRTGKVRMAAVKARQQGFSEKVASRGFKRATQNKGVAVYILSCEQASTTVLYDKVQRYYRYLPDFEGIKPGLRTGNRTQMKFDNESEYTVGTAGSDNAGVSNTIQFAHISEPALYDNPESIKTGLLQTISDAPGTEIWWESTARGKNWYYKFLKNILAGKIPGYEVIFVPWFWTRKYRAQPQPGFQRTQEEIALSAMATRFNKDTKQIEPRELDDAQLQWRRNKIAELGENIFKQEYPAYFEEAFIASGDSFHDSNLVHQARKTIILERDLEGSPTILGMDAGRTHDRSVFTWRTGRKIRRQHKIDNKKDPHTNLQLAGICIAELESGRVDYVMMDIAYAHGVYDILVAEGWGDRVVAINFGSAAEYDPIYANKRAEMAHDFDEWLKDGPNQLPDDDDLAADIASMPPPKPNRNGKLVCLDKEEIKKKLGHSPDCYDSLLTTFGRRVRLPNQGFTPTQVVNKATRGTSQLVTQRRRNEYNRGESDYGRSGGFSGTERGSGIRYGYDASWGSRPFTE